MRTFSPPNLSEAKEMVYDTETDGLDWKKNKVVGYVITWGPRPDESKYFPVGHAGGSEADGNYNRDEVERWVKDITKRPGVMWTGHHMKFDLHMSQNHGILFPRHSVNCTQVNAAILNENQGSYSLDTCAKKYGVFEKKGEALYQHLANLFGGEPTRQQMQHFWRLRGDDPLAVDYAEGDGISTWAVWQYQKALLQDSGDEHTPGLDRIWAMECKIIQVLQTMERRGVLINMERLVEVENTVADLVDKARDALPKDFNPRSSTQMKKLMLDHGITQDKWPTTALGNPSFTEKFLLTNEIGKQVINLRKYTNLQNSFLKGQIRNHLHEGRVHTTFNQLKMDDYGVITGRLSSSSPNLQQVQKRNKELAKLLRSIFVPRPKMVWSANDYKQQEYVVFSHYSGSEKLRSGYNSDPVIDMHQMCADLMGVDRDTAKRLNLGKLYGMGVAKLAASLEIPLDEAQALSRKWELSVPEARGFMKRADKVAMSRGFVYTIMGRRRNFPNGRDTHIAGNAVVQMCSADITKQKMVEIDDYFHSIGYEAYLTLQVHDELNWEYPVGRKDIDDEALRIMQAFGPDDEIPLKARLLVDHSEGKNWAEATFHG